jgi:major type 1 subunit fimbrin (pilin)
MKKTLLVAALFASGLVSTASYAGPTGTITVTGNVGTSSCVLQTGSTNVSVPLPRVDPSMLANANDVIGITGFQLKVDSCTAGTKISASFSPDSNTDANGNLTNTSTSVSGVTNAQVQLLDQNRQAINLMNDTGFASRQVVASGGTTTLQYYAQYFAKQNNTTPGDLLSSIQFLMSYE